MTDPVWVQEARKYVGLREIEGSRHEPGVVQFFADSGNAWVKDDETAWCGAFVSAMFVRAGMPTVRPPGEAANALRARMWLNVGMPVETPRVGDLAIFWRGKKTGAQGHVGFFISEGADDILVLGGNQSNAVSIARYAKSRLLGYRRPFEQKPDDPGVDTPSPPKRQETPPGASQTAGSPFAVVAAIIFGALLYAARRLFKWPFKEDGRLRVLGIIWLVIVLGGGVALFGLAAGWW